MWRTRFWRLHDVAARGGVCTASRSPGGAARLVRHARSPGGDGLTAAAGGVRTRWRPGFAGEHQNVAAGGRAIVRDLPTETRCRRAGGTDPRERERERGPGGADDRAAR